jgi:hypothetical protein
MEGLNLKKLNVVEFKESIRLKSTVCLRLSKTWIIMRTSIGLEILNMNIKTSATVSHGYYVLKQHKT